MILDKLNYSVKEISGIGEYYNKKLSRIGINKICDLLTYFPRTYSDRSSIVSLKEAVSLESATVKVKVVDHRLVGNEKRKFLKIIIFDGKNFGSLLCFNRNFLKNVLQIGKNFYITGKFYYKFNEIQAANFEYEEVEKTTYTGKIVPIYPLPEGFSQRFFRNSIRDAIKKYYSIIEDELPSDYIQKRSLLHKRDAVKNVHFPENFLLFSKAKKTFIYEEFFYQRLFLLKRKEILKKIKKERKQIDFVLKKKLIKTLPFELMDFQIKAIEEIENDIFSDHVFSRLLQGDVGSGKTMVALITMLSVIEAGLQCAFMAPTEVLARQHYKTITRFLKDLDIKVGLLIGSLKKSEKEEIMSKIGRGELQLIIGTHALFSEDVVYNNLGYVVIDEQQRFGVEQRYQLINKGKDVDLLMMTATPIPRSLALSLYGDMEITLMQGVIRGRLPVKTWFIYDDPSRRRKMHEWIKTTLKNEGGRVIFVYALIETSEKIESKNLFEEYEELKVIYKDFGTGFIHSRVSEEEKETIMQDFTLGKIKVLASTTIVEVGIDVPDANIIVVENAESYGLSTLHQLRGRVGRNNKQSYMILIADPDRLTEVGKKRLEIMVKEHDGFKIAEYDLLLRGPGEFLGNRQSGLPEYRFADIRRDMEILKEASDDALEFLKTDPDFNLKENYNIKISFLNRLKNYEKLYKRVDV